MASSPQTSARIPCYEALQACRPVVLSTGMPLHKNEVLKLNGARSIGGDSSTGAQLEFLAFVFLCMLAKRADCTLLLTDEKFEFFVQTHEFLVLLRPKQLQVQGGFLRKILQNLIDCTCEALVLGTIGHLHFTPARRCEIPGGSWYGLEQPCDSAACSPPLIPLSAAIGSATILRAAQKQ
jgi:hypothetical protein